MANKEKFLNLVSQKDTKVVEKNEERIKNRAMLRESQRIALKVLMKLDELGWSQKDLAQALKVTPQQISKIVSGKENLTIETQIKLQEILDIPIFATYHEYKQVEAAITLKSSIERFVTNGKALPFKYKGGGLIIKCSQQANAYTYNAGY